MCYDVSFTVDIKQITDYFPNLVFDDQLKMNFTPVHIIGHNYAEHPIIYQNKEDNKLHLKLMEWGCIPFYVKDEKAFIRQRAGFLNARCERILGDAKSYWYKIKNRRCLIPVSGIYEHRKVPKFKKKVPYFITLKEQPLFFLPGLYSVAELPNKETGEVEKRFTYTLITRNANSIMKQIHNDGENAFRMPLFLPFELSKKWVEDELTEKAYLEILDYEMPSEALDYIPVWTIRGREERSDNKEKNEYFEWENLPAIEV
jgi:putative SOS response-associated peptidase YedK